MNIIKEIIEMISIILAALGGGLFIGLIISFYLLPWIIAYNRNVRNKDLILCLTIFLGATGIGWIACLLWACYDHKIDEMHKEIANKCINANSVAAADDA